ncbi:MAG: LptF/LptG family permease, partial [Planctomycetota bacterium]
MRPLNRLSRYVFGQLQMPTVLGLLLFTFVLLMNQLFFVAQKVITLGLSWDTSARLLIYQMPRLLVMTIPMGTLLGSLIAVGRLSADHEWEAIQGAGRGPGFLLRSVAIHGLAATLICLFVYLVVFPRANYAARELNREILFTSKLGSDLRPRVFYTDLPNLVLFVDEIRPGTQGRLEGVLIHMSEAEGGLDQLILAREGDMYPSPDRSGSLELDLRDGVVHGYNAADPERYRVFRFATLHRRIPPPPLLQAFQGDPTPTVLDMDLPRLLHEARLAEDLDAVVRELRLRRVWQEINLRFALPTAAFLFAILGVPLGITRVRSGKGAGFALAIIVIAVYWLVFTSTRDLGNRGLIPPWLGVWAANLVMAGWFVVAMWRLRRGVSREGVLRRAFQAITAPALRVLARIERDPRSSAEARGESRPGRMRAGFGSGWISLVDRHISLHFLRIFGLTLLSTYMIYFIVELRDLIDATFESGKPLARVLLYFQYMTPGMLTLVLPVSCLVGGVVAFTLLARSGELTAVLSSGFSLRRATVPVLIITLALCGVYFLIQNNIAPITNQKAQQVKDDLEGRRPRSYGMSSGGRWTFGSEGRLYHYGLYDPGKRQFQGLTVFTIDRDSLRIVDHRFANSALWDGALWTLGAGWYSNPSEDIYRAAEAGERLALDPPDNFARQERTLRTSRSDLTEQMSVLELREQIVSLRDSGYDTVRLKVDYFSKL